jgi:HEAT repeat protein
MARVITGKRAAIIAASCGILVLVFAGLRWKDFAAQVHLHRLRASPGRLFEILEEPEGTPARMAIRRFLKESEEARRMLLARFVEETAKENQPNSFFEPQACIWALAGVQEGTFIYMEVSPHESGFSGIANDRSGGILQASGEMLDPLLGEEFFLPGYPSVKFRVIEGTEASRISRVFADHGAHPLGKSPVCLLESMILRTTVPDLIESLASEDVTIREYAAVELRRKAPEAKAAIPALIAALSDDSRRVRGLAADALGAIGSEAREAIPKLLDVVRDLDGDDDPNSRLSSVSHALAAIGEDSVPFLLEALRGEPGNPRLAAAWSLSQLSPEEALDPLIEALRDTRQDLSMPIAFALCTYGEKARKAMPLLLECMRDRNRWGRSVIAAGVIWKVDPAGKEAFEALLRCLRDESPDMIGSAAIGLSKMEDKTAAVPHLIQALKESPLEARKDIAIALGIVGPAAREANPLLEKLLEDLGKDSTDSREEVQKAIEEALEKIKRE